MCVDTTQTHIDIKYSTVIFSQSNKARERKAKGIQEKWRK
jgi:hypothetical protein